VASIRGEGLLLGVQLDEGLEAPAVYARMLDHGVICNAVNPTTIRLAPPLTVTEVELAEAAAALRSVLEEDQV
jgi:acetylornithine/succinyldiaminopimelate/putrescine aminotransferase